MFDMIAEKINKMLDERYVALVEHLSKAQNKVKIQIKINSTEDVSLEIELNSKQKLAFEGEGCAVSPRIPNQPVKPSPYKIIGLEASIFQAEKYKKEITEAVNHYVTPCRFQSLPLVINIYVKSDNTITGNLVSNFVFNRR